MRRLCFAIALLSLHCSGGNSSLTDGGSPLFIADAGPLTAVFAGYAWDPEAYLFSVLTCGPTCPASPSIQDGDLLFTRAEIVDASVGVFDSSLGAVTAHTVSGPDGTWRVFGIPQQPTAPYFMEMQGPGTLLNVPQDPLPPVPVATEYFPTGMLNPIFATYSACYLQEAALVSNAGVLAAVAAHLGVPTSDLINPARFAGVHVFALYSPGFLTFRLPAFGTGMVASAGNAYQIDWAPPGFLPPGAKQSQRGFVVSPLPVSPIGVTVVVFPSAPQGPVSYAVADSSSDPSQGHPWLFPAISAPVVPGQVGYGELQLFPAPSNGGGGPSPVPPWLCSPPPGP